MRARRGPPCCNKKNKCLRPHAIYSAEPGHTRSAPAVHDRMPKLAVVLFVFAAMCSAARAVLAAFERQVEIELQSYA